MIFGVSSVEVLSTSSNSDSGVSWGKTLSMARCRKGARLRVQMATVTRSVAGLCTRQESPGGAASRSFGLIGAELFSSKCHMPPNAFSGLHFVVVLLGCELIIVSYH